MAPSVAPRMQMYPPGAPGIGQQIFYGQAPPAIIPPQVILNVSIVLFIDHPLIFSCFYIVSKT